MRQNLPMPFGGAWVALGGVGGCFGCPEYPWWRSGAGRGAEGRCGAVPGCGVVHLLAVTLD